MRPVEKASPLIALALLLSACTAPVQQDIVTFGKTAEILAAGTGDIYQRHIDLNARLDLERGAAEYSDREIVNYVFPPRSVAAGADEQTVAERAKLDEEERILWMQRLSAMGAIRDYAKALAEINNPLVANTAEAALATLGNAVAGMQGSPLPQPVGQLAAGFVASGIRSQNAATIRATILKVHPLIEATTRALSDDFGTLQDAVQGNFEEWQAEAIQALRVLRLDPGVNASDLQEAYRRAAERNLANARLVDAYAGTVAALENFEAAHRALATSEDESRALSEFLRTTAGFADSVAELRAGGS